MTNVSRIMVSAPSAGHGKTAVSVGLLAALTARNSNASAFKLGPDYVDSAYLGMACGSVGRNLDPRMVGSARIPELFSHGSEGTDIAVVEGAFGLFDGMTLAGDTDSTAHVARSLRAPVILVVDAANTGNSLAPLVHGFRTWDELTWLGGVILTRVSSDRHEQILRDALREVGVPVLGAYRRNDLAALPARHHGIVPVVDRSMEALRAVRRLGEATLDRVDLDRVEAIARSAPRLSETSWTPLGGAPVSQQPPVDGPVVAVAGGSYFTYSYAENVELLQAAGATVAVVDPLRDERLPEGCQGLLFGGGFPERYVEELTSNVELGRDVAKLAKSGAPIAAESSGFVWLSDELDGRPMIAVLPAATRTNSQPVLGYRAATACSDSVLLKSGAEITGHKNHWTTVSPRAGDTAAWNWRNGRAEGYVEGNIHASYLNLHWAAQPDIAKRFVSHIGTDAA